MIVDLWRNISKYEGQLKNLDAAIRAIEALEEKKVGRYEFEGGFFMIQEGDTRFVDDGEFEAHRKYLDIQYITGGCEEMAWADIDDVKETVPFDEGKDIGFYGGDRSHHMLISPGMFYVVFPHDAHEPCIHTGDQPHHYNKIVIKLPVE